MSSRLWLAAIALTALTACNTVNKNIATEDPYLGEAVAYDTAIQVINPDPVYPEDGAKPGDNGDRAAQAVKRYREDQALERHNREAKQNSGISTTGGTSSNGGGSSGPH